MPATNSSAFLNRHLLRDTVAVSYTLKRERATADLIATFANTACSTLLIPTNA